MEATLLSHLLDGPGGTLHLLQGSDVRTIEASVERAALSRLAEGTAAVLRTHGIEPGSPVVLALPTGLEFVRWFLGALWLGAIPIPLPAPLKARGKLIGMDRVAHVLEASAPSAIVAQGRLLPTLAEHAGDARLLAAELEPGRGGIPRATVRDAQTAFVQYTAGSTGNPKGVVVTYRNLRANLEAIGQGLEVSELDRAVSWLPLHHDMGLVGNLLVCLYWRMTLYLYSPIAFALRPASWLEAISHYRATLSAGPHFAYSLCAHRVDPASVRGLDLSSWRLALDGAEPIAAANVRDFIARYAPFGFRPEAYHPVYGMSEATLAATFPHPGEGAHIDQVQRSRLASGQATPATGDEETSELVSVGRPLPGMSLSVHDPRTGQLVPERAVGEIWLQGPSLSPRYLGEEGQDREVLRTGDLGYLAGGRLYVVDRIKDVIIHGGMNVYPRDLEMAAGNVEGVRKGRVVALGVPDAELGTENLVVVAEVRQRWRRAKLEAAIREALLSHCGVNVAQVKLVAPRTLPLTSSGKLQRTRTRALVTSGRL